MNASPHRLRCRLGKGLYPCLSPRQIAIDPQGLVYPPVFYFSAITQPHEFLSPSAGPQELSRLADHGKRLRAIIELVSQAVSDRFEQLHQYLI
jgi:hypothetical protein